jgi:hypothetical protein
MVDGGGGFVGSIDNISVKELPGNHAVQATAANRPIYGVHPFGGRRNLLVRTEEFENASWTKLRLNTTANAATSPDGTTTADYLIDTAVSGTHVAIQLITKAASAITYTASVYLKAAARTKVEFRVSDQAGNGVRLAVDLSDGSVGAAVGFGTGFTAASSAIQAVENGWHRVTLTATSNSATSLGHEVYVCDASGNTSYTGDGTSGIYAWGAQLETGSTATAYQRVTDQYNVTEAGVSSVSYLFFDGVNDSLATPSINFPVGPTSPTLGPELVTNGGFATDTAWTKGTGWAISGGTASHSGGTFGAITQNMETQVGKSYRLTANLTYTSGGSIQFFENGSGGQTWATSQTISHFFVATANNSPIGFGAGTGNWTIDNISVREIDAAQAPDKMTVFAGVRKLSTSTAVILETSSISPSNAGSVGLFGPDSLNQYTLLTRGTTTALAATTSASFAAPITNVLTGIGDISGDVSRLRINGTQVAETLTDQGTGNYLAYPLFIGARNNASLLFSGHLYSLIVRGAQSNTGQISSTETWVASRTGITI